MSPHGSTWKITLLKTEFSSLLQSIYSSKLSKPNTLASTNSYVSTFNINPEFSHFSPPSHCQHTVPQHPLTEMDSCLPNPGFLCLLRDTFPKRPLQLGMARQWNDSRGVWEETAWPLSACLYKPPSIRPHVFALLQRFQLATTFPACLLQQRTLCTLPYGWPCLLQLLSRFSCVWLCTTP